MENKYLLNRRQFIQLITASLSLYPLSSIAKSNTFKKDLQGKIKEEPWRTIFSVQEHLFPSEVQSIGANDINALNYLKNTINTPGFEKSEKEFIENGVKWLNSFSKKQYSKYFYQLSTEEKEKTLRKIEGSTAGSNWLSAILSYLLQALLMDPIYGGNPKGIAWQWLSHQPGFPRPTENKKYFKLKQKRIRKTKA